MARRALVEILISARDATTTAFRSVQGRLSGMMNSLMSIKTAVAGFAAFVVARIGNDIVKAFADQEEAIIKLNAVLRETGRFTVEGSKKIQAMADTMQKLTTASDDAALSVSTLVGQFAQELTVDQLAEVQKAAVGLAQAFGMDLQSAARLIGKTLGGERDALSRFGISLEGATTQQEKFNLLMEKAAVHFNVAVAATKSLNGQLLQAANAIGEVKETLGEAIIRSLGFGEQGESMATKIHRFNDSLKENMAQIVRWGRTVVAVIKALGIGFKENFDFAGHWFNLFQNGAKMIVAAIPALVEAIKNAILDALSPIAQKLGFELPEKERKFTNLFLTHLDQVKMSARGVKDSFNAVKDAWLAVWETAQKTPILPDLSDAGAGPNRETIKPLAERIGKGIVKAGAQVVEGPKANIGLGVVAHEIEHIQEMLAPKGPTFVEAFIEELTRASQEMGGLEESLGRVAHTALVDFAGSAVAAFGKLGAASELSAAAFAEAFAGAIASVADHYAQLFAAKGAAALGEGFLGHPGAFAAAAKFFSAAALMSFLAGSIRSAASGGGGGGTGSQNREQARTDSLADEKKPGTIIVQGGLLDMSDPRQADALAGALEELSGRRVIIKNGEG